jgi:hypothetical protein
MPIEKGWNMLNKWSQRKEEIMAASHIALYSLSSAILSTRAHVLWSKVVYIGNRMIFWTHHYHIQV